MLAKQLISNTINPLKTSDTASAALQMMEDYKVLHLPIVNNVEFLALISEDDILSLNEPDEALGNHKLSLTRPFVNEDQHIFDVIRVFSELKLSLIPVLDKKNNYLGTITLLTLVHNLSKIIALDSPGGIIILELNQNDYSLTEISQIIESNDAKVLSLYIYSYPNSIKIDVTIKINKIDITQVLKTFNRYNYTIKASFSEFQYIDDIKTRYDLLMNYLNM